MVDSTSYRKRYLFIGSVGMLVGGLLTVIATNAIPKMMSRMMCGMMNNMMSQSSGRPLTPEEM